MFVVLLKFAQQRSRAAEHMEAHKAWLRRGFEEQVFLLAGSLMPSAGGAVLAHNTSLNELEDRLKMDPFVEHGVVSTEVLEISPSIAADAMQFLMAK